jgi:hypothetical protein
MPARACPLSPAAPMYEPKHVPCAAWDATLQALIKDEGVSLRAIARHINLDPKYVKRHAQRIGAWRPEWRQISIAKKGESPYQRVARARNQWVDALIQYPDLGVKALRAKYSATYAVLYRNDREWLYLHRPPPAMRTACIARVDWEARDSHIALMTEKAAADLRERVPPIWVTPTCIVRHIGVQAMVEQHAQHLPETHLALTRLAETRMDFARRKVAYVTQLYRASHVAAEPWEIVRRANLRPDLARALDLIIREASYSLKPHENQNRHRRPGPAVSAT